MSVPGMATSVFLASRSGNLTNIENTPGHAPAVIDYTITNTGRFYTATNGFLFMNSNWTLRFPGIEELLQLLAALGIDIPQVPPFLFGALPFLP